MHAVQSSAISKICKSSTIELLLIEINIYNLHVLQHLYGHDISTQYAYN